MWHMSHSFFNHTLFCVSGDNLYFRCFIEFVFESYTSLKTKQTKNKHYSDVNPQIVNFNYAVLAVFCSYNI